MSGSDSPEQGIIEQYSSFFRLLGSSLTGITAVFMAAGFLAERARLAMLGLPATTFDLQQYLEVGARLIALLPVLAGNAVLLMIAGLFDTNTNHSPSSSPILDAGFWIAMFVAVIVIASLALQWWRSPRPRNTTRFTARVKSLLKENLLLVVLPGLVYLLFVQIHVTDKQLIALEVRDMLFESTTEQAGDGSALRQWRMNGNTVAALKFFGRILFLSLISGTALYLIVTAVLPRQQDSTIWRRVVVRIWIGISGLLLVSQVTLLPVTYGTMLSQNQFSDTCITLAEPKNTPANALPDTRLVLVHETPSGIYAYSRTDRTMWYVPRQNVERIAYFNSVDVLSRPDTPKTCPAN